MSNKSLGGKGERIAAIYLRNNGFCIEETNYRFKRVGEIDIIAVKSGQLHFVEVKTRTGIGYGTPGESVVYAKREKIRRVAQAYICCRKSLGKSKNNLDNISIHFDVIEIDLHNGKINFLEDAF